MKSYEMEDSGGRVVCRNHGRIRCDQCEYVAELEADNDRLYNKSSELYSIALWCARRLAVRQYAEFAYDEIEKVVGYEVDRDWRGEQV